MTTLSILLSIFATVSFFGTFSLFSSFYYFLYLYEISKTLILAPGQCPLSPQRIELPAVINIQATTFKDQKLQPWPITSAFAKKRIGLSGCDEWKRTPLLERGQKNSQTIALIYKSTSLETKNNLLW